MLDLDFMFCCSQAWSKRITEPIAYMVAKDMCSLRLVEGEGFIKLMNYLEPSYKVLSAAQISKLQKAHRGFSEANSRTS